MHWIMEATFQFSLQLGAIWFCSFHHWSRKVVFSWNFENRFFKANSIVLWKTLCHWLRFRWFSFVCFWTNILQLSFSSLFSFSMESVFCGFSFIRIKAWNQLFVVRQDVMISTPTTCVTDRTTVVFGGLFSNVWDRLYRVAWALLLLMSCLK